MADRPPLPARLADAELWRCVEATLLDVVLPALADDQPWARAAAVQLVGLARHAAVRPADPTPDRAAELADALDGLRANPIVGAVWQGDDRSMQAAAAAAGAALAAAVGRDDDAADQVRNVVRQLVVRQLDDELAVTGSLVDAFRGRLDA